MQRWQNKIAVVTGASSGIGAETVKALARKGLNVVGFARRKERIDQLAEELKLENISGRAFGIKVDLTIEEDILNAFTWVLENLGPVSILINNAGIIQNTSLIDGDTNKWKKLMDTNVMAYAICSREAIRQMKSNDIDNGHIICINSIVGHKVPTGTCNNLYAASKFAVTAFTECLRNELVAAKSNIKISNISPGVVKTELLQSDDLKDLFDFDINALPALEPENIAHAIIFVLSTPPNVQIHDMIIKPVGELL